MPARLLIGGVAAAVALSVTPAHADPPSLPCMQGFEVVCTVVALVCKVTGEDPCHP